MWCIHAGFHFESFLEPGEDTLMLSRGGWGVGLMSIKIGKLEPQVLSFRVLLLLFMS